MAGACGRARVLAPFGILGELGDLIGDFLLLLLLFDVTKRVLGEVVVSFSLLESLVSLDLFGVDIGSSTEGKTKREPDSNEVPPS